MRTAQILIEMLLCCLLLVVIEGCSFHRTPHGFVVGSQWSLEYRHVPWLKFRAGQDFNDDGVSDKSDSSIAAEKHARPELLPWRNRLRGYRLGSRLFHPKDVENNQLTAEIAADSKDEPMPLPPPAPRTKSDEKLPDSKQTVLKPDNKVEQTSLSGLNSQLPLPERTQPDVVVD